MSFAMGKTVETTRNTFTFLNDSILFQGLPDAFAWWSRTRLRCADDELRSDTEEQPFCTYCRLRLFFISSHMLRTGIGHDFLWFYEMFYSMLRYSQVLKQTHTYSYIQILGDKFIFYQVDMPVPEKEIDVGKELQRLEKQLNQAGFRSVDMCWWYWELARWFCGGVRFAWKHREEDHTTVHGAPAACYSLCVSYLRCIWERLWCWRKLRRPNRHQKMSQSTILFQHW